MLKKRIIPLLLLMDGRLVKSVNFDNFKDVGNPVSSVKIFNNSDADELILLNIKKLALVLHEKDKIEIVLRKKGSGPVLASHIEDHPNLEIKNPDFCIANITNDKT